MSRAVTGWLWVGGQAVILGALVFLPGRDDWATPGWLDAAGSVLFFGGFAIMIVAALRLGTGLTPTPVPSRFGSLKTDGLYRYVRHPIYTGVLAVVAGIAVRSGSWIHAVIGLGAIVFFDRKAAWEETALAERYPNYADYASSVPRFLPHPSKRAPSR